MKYFKICRVRCKSCGTMLEYENRSKDDAGPGSLMVCGCGKVALDPSASLYRIIGKVDNWEDLSEVWEEN